MKVERCQINGISEQDASSKTTLDICVLQTGQIEFLKTEHEECLELRYN